MNTDPTVNYHGYNPQSSAAYAKAQPSLDTLRRQLEYYVEEAPLGRTSKEAEHDFRGHRPSITARFTEMKQRQSVFRVADLHLHDMYLELDAKRPDPWLRSRSGSEVVVGRKRVLSRYGQGKLDLVIATVEAYQSRKRGATPPITQLSDGHWEFYRFVDDRGSEGATAEETGTRLGTDQSMSSSRFTHLKAVRLFITVKELQRLGLFPLSDPTRPTRQNHSAAVLISYHTILRSEIDTEMLDWIWSPADLYRIERLLKQRRS